MAAFPIGPRHARMLLAAAAFEPTVPGVLHHGLALAAAISQESPFLSSSGECDEAVRGQADTAEAEEADAEVRVSLATRSAYADTKREATDSRRSDPADDATAASD